MQPEPVAAGPAAGPVAAQPLAGPVAGERLGAIDWLRPDWAVRGVGACMTTRHGGTSHGAFQSMNVGNAVGDDATRVGANRAILAGACGAGTVFLRQVHGARVVRVGARDAAPGAPVHEADACVTTEPGVACVVQVADCLPVLFAAPGARAVGAAHAGWRGLAAGVLENTADAVAEAAGCNRADLVTWLGACIGAEAFEVGPEVRAAFAGDTDPALAAQFRTGEGDRWFADLRGLARERLRGVGVSRVSASDACVVRDASRFFSYRRDGITGRMAACVWIDRRR